MQLTAAAGVAAVRRTCRRTGRTPARTLPACPRGTKSQVHPLLTNHPRWFVGGFDAPPGPPKSGRPLRTKTARAAHVDFESRGGWNFTLSAASEMRCGSAADDRAVSAVAPGAPDASDRGRPPPASVDTAVVCPPAGSAESARSSGSPAGSGSCRERLRRVCSFTKAALRGAAAPQGEAVAGGGDTCPFLLSPPGRAGRRGAGRRRRRPARPSW